MPDRRLHTFRGGLHLETFKTLSDAAPSRPLPLPERLYLSLHQGSGPLLEPLAGDGERVLKGQRIAGGPGQVPLHAPTSGRISRSEAPSAHASGMPLPCLALEPDGLEEWVTLQPIADPLAQSPELLLARIEEAGIVGLGGAGFPTARKLASGAIETLIINGAECEPYITCDDRLMRESTDELLEGIRILRHLTGARHTIIAIEDDMPNVCAAMCESVPGGIEAVTVPARYPTGGERQLIQVLLGTEVPSGKYPADLGVLVQNVATVVAVYRAIRLGEPLISRLVTMTGDVVPRPGNFRVLFGTPVADVLVAAGLTPSTLYRLLMGGPLMGIELSDPATPVVKTTNCLLAQPPRLEDPPRACIRCGDCVDVCPVGLLPQQLYWYARARDLDQVEAYNLADCIECGCCAYVCPSDISLVQYYRHAKHELRVRAEDRLAADRARRRHEAHEARAEREKREREERRRRKKEQIAANLKKKDARQQTIQDSVDRSKARKAEGQAADA